MRNIFIGCMVLLGMTLALTDASAALPWTEDFSVDVPSPGDGVAHVPSGWTGYMATPPDYPYVNPFVNADVSGGQQNYVASGTVVVEDPLTYGYTQGFLISTLTDPGGDSPEVEDVEASVVTQISGNISYLYSGMLVRGQGIMESDGIMPEGKAYVYFVSGYDSNSHAGAGEAGLYRLDSDGSGVTPETALEIDYLSDEVFADLADNDIYMKLSAITTDVGTVLLKGMMSYSSDFSDPFGIIEYEDGLGDNAGLQITGAGLTGLIANNNADDSPGSCNWDNFTISEAMIIPGDTNYDGIVDATDAATLADNWLSSGATWSMGDFDDSGVVDAADATILAANWQTGSTAAVPEPGALMLVVGGLLLLVFRRRK